jgi:two-component system sensor histidine kinase GlrK
VKRKTPTSILKLTLIGFSIVAVPLIAALVSTVLQVERLSVRIKGNVFNAAESVETSRILLSQVIALERSAQQYLVLQDPSVLERYEEQRKQLYEVVRDLSELELNTESRERLLLVAGTEQRVYDRLRQYTPADDENIEETRQRLPALAELARPMPFEIGQAIARQTDRLSQQAYELRELLLWQAVALIPLAVILAIAFSLLIARPLRQISGGIRKLGDGDLLQPIEVSGPQDIRDLGDRLEWLRHRLQELEQQKTMFLRHVSHELKTPLTAIREGIELLHDGVVGSVTPDQAEVIAILQSSSRQLQDQIENLLKFNVALAERSLTRPVPVRVDKLFEEVIRNQSLALRGRSVQLVTRLESTTVCGDPEQLRTVIDNLLSNAVKYSPVKGTIRVTLERGDDAATFIVEDEGPGIDASERERVFDAFYQGRRAPGGHVKGTGLGLAISERYVGLHNGRIDILDAPRGAHVRVTLPLEIDKCETEPD